MTYKHRSRNKYIKRFLDITILFTLRKKGSLHGYGIIADIHDSYGVLVSPGTLYPLLRSLESDGMVKSETDGRRTIFELTEKGEDELDDSLKSLDQTRHLFGLVHD